MPDNGIRRVPTGIPGLDELIEDGLPEGTVNLVSGPAGGAKSLFGLHFICNGAMDFGESGLYVTIEESKASLIKTARRVNIDIPALEERGLIYIMDLTAIRTLGSKEEEMEMKLLKCDRLLELIEMHIARSGVKRLCFDSLTAVGLAYRDIDELRADLFRFAQALRGRGITSILLTETLEGKLSRFGVEQFITDSFIVLGLERIKGELRRTLTVRKMRYTRQESSIHPFIIMNDGIVVAADEKVV
jgi:circadian clock protein KaiC